jgi:hypothetical protein
VTDGGTDDQNLESAILTGSDLDINIEGGNDVTADLAALATDAELLAAITASETLDGDISDTNEIQNVTSIDNSVTITPSATGNDFDLSVAGGGTDDQNLESAILTGSDLDINIEGGNNVTADLAALATDAELITLTDTKENTINKSTDITLADATDTLFPTALAVKTYVDTQVGAITAGNNLAIADQPLSANRTINLNGNELYFTGTGNIGIGTTNPAAKFHVSGGQVRAATFSSGDGMLAEPGYRFSDDSDTGMWSPAADELSFSAGGQEILNLKETVGNGLEIRANGSLELTEQLLDENGNVGNVGEILTSTNTGTEWKQPAVVAMGKSNGANSINSNNAIVSGGGGINLVTFDNPRPDGDYIIQLTVLGDNRIYVTAQNNLGFTVEIKQNQNNSLVVTEWYYTVLDF